MASLQVGLEAREGSEGASPEVLEVNHLADLGVGHLVDPEVGRLVDPEVGCLVDLEVGCLVVPVGGHLVGLEVDHLEDPEGDDLVVQVVDSHHLWWQEAALEEGGKLDRHRSLGRNKIPG